jgi:ketosteroid isomerase-like protein
MTLDCDAVLARCADDVTFEFPFISGSPLDAAGFKRRVQRTITLMTELRFVDLEVSPVGDDAIVARYAGSAQISLTDRPYVQKYLSLFEFDDGRLTYFQENFDTAAFKTAFGLDPGWQMR